MCRHCVNLVEDKDIVHEFMAVGARRLSEMHGVRIRADDIEVTMTISDPRCRFPSDNYGNARKRVYRLLAALGKG